MDRVLLVDDDHGLCDLLAEYLGTEGFDVAVVHDGESAVPKASGGDFSLIVLDVMLPGKSGLDVLRELRRTSDVPVLMLTARGDDVDRIVGLELGADDYLPKPFNPRELSARMRAILRRGRPAAADADEAQGSHEATLTVGGLRLDPSARFVSVDGRRTDLTTMEYDLLEALMQEPGTTCSRERLMQQVFKRPFTPFDRSLDVHISNLRHKIGPYPDGSDRIKTVRGVGYILAFPPEEAKGG